MIVSNRKRSIVPPYICSDDLSIASIVSSSRLSPSSLGYMERFYKV